jgi:MscS family membrane protein
MGRVILFFIVIVLFAILDYLVYKKVYIFLKKIILKHKDSFDEILLKDLNRIRKPISFLVIIIGLRLAIEILIYPTDINDTISSIFYMLEAISIVYILFIAIDNLVFIYLNNKNDENIRKELLSLMVSITKVVIFFIGFLLILVRFGIDISGILASLGIGGLAVALAAQNTLANFFGLIKMIIDKSFSIGDWIQTDTIEGTVVKIGFISTKIRTFDNALITVPNSTLANGYIKNWNKRKIGRRIKLHLTLTYKSKKANLQNAILEIKQMLQQHPGIITNNKVDYKQINKFYEQEQKLTSFDDKYGIKTTLLVYLDKFSDSSIDILVYTFSKTTSWEEWLRVKEDVLFKIWDIIEKNQLEFAYPTQTIYLEK